jgi:predicted MFS family arabinose efflux permease
VVDDAGAEHGGASPVPRHWGEDLRLLRQRDLGLLVAARFVSVLGSGIAPIALAFGVLAIPGGSPSALGFVLFCAALPRAAFVLFGGVAADRFDRARLMVVSESIAGAAHLAAGALFLTGSATVPALGALAAVGGSATALFFPALTGLVPEVATDDELQAANGLVRLATNVAGLVGAALGGILVVSVGPGWALAFDGLTFVLAAVLLLFVRRRQVVARPARSATQGVVADLRVGWREFVARRWVVVIVVLAAFSNVGFNAAIDVLGPVQAKAELGGAGPWAAIVTSFGLGAVLGVLVAMRVRPKRPLLLASIVAPVMVLPVAALAPPLPLPAIVVLAFFAGVAADVFGVLWDTALQQNIPGDALSRVSAYDWFGSLALVPLGLAAVGPLAEAVGVETAIWVTFALGSVIVLALLDPQVRNLRSGRPADVPRPG